MNWKRLEVANLESWERFRSPPPSLWPLVNRNHFRLIWLVSFLLLMNDLVVDLWRISAQEDGRSVLWRITCRFKQDKQKDGMGASFWGPSHGSMVTVWRFWGALLWGEMQNTEMIVQPGNEWGLENLLREILNSLLFKVIESEFPFPYNWRHRSRHIFGFLTTFVRGKPSLTMGKMGREDRKTEISYHHTAL